METDIDKLARALKDNNYNIVDIQGYSARFIALPDENIFAHQNYIANNTIKLIAIKDSEKVVLGEFSCIEAMAKIEEITSSRIKELADIIDKAQVEALTSGKSFNKGFGLFCAKKIIQKGYRKND